MMFYKLRLKFFLLMISALSAGALISFSHSEVGIISRIIALLMLPPICGGLLYIFCFSPELFTEKSNKPSIFPFQP